MREPKANNQILTDYFLNSQGSCTVVFRNHFDSGKDFIVGSDTLQTMYSNGILPFEYIGKKLCYYHSDISIIFKNHCTILKNNALWRQ